MAYDDTYYPPTDFGSTDYSQWMQPDYSQQMDPSLQTFSEYGQQGPSTGVYGQPAGGGNNAGGSSASWLAQLMKTVTSGQGGGQSGGMDWMRLLAGLGSGAYGMYQANKMGNQAQSAIAGSSPWTTSGGTALAGEQLKGIMTGDFTNDAGFKAAQSAAARSSSQQPGGFAASAAAQAALKYQNDRIQALGPAAGVGFSPAAGYQVGLQGTQGANQLAGQGLASIGYGLTPSGSGMPPWLQQYLVQNGMSSGVTP